MPRGNHKNHVRGPDHARWNGGVALSEHGYLRIQVGKDHPLADPNGYAYVHRLVLSAALGRTLSNDEVVHHRDGNKLNNRLNNLDLLSSSEHSSRHNLKRRRDAGGRYVGDKPACI